MCYLCSVQLPDTPCKWMSRTRTKSFLLVHMETMFYLNIDVKSSLKWRWNEIKGASNFFNKREGCILHRVVRHHNVVREKNQYCALCSINKGNDLPRVCLASVRSKCHETLCTIPRSGEKGLSCFEYWHCTNILHRRQYFSKPAQ